MKIKKIEGETARLAGLQIDHLQKLRSGQTSLEEFEMFLNMKPAKRNQVFGTNPWLDQVSRNFTFWQKHRILVDINLPLPEFTEGHRLEYVPASKTETDLVKMYDKEFGNLASNGYSQDPTSIIHTQQDRPKGDYWFSWNPTIEPDTEHLNKSYNIFKNDDNNYMIPREGIIAAYSYRCETGNMFDVKGVTYFQAADADGHVLCMFRDVSGGFFIGFDFPGFQDSDRGPRQIKISKTINF